MVEVAATAPVLIVDGDPQASDAFFLSTALSPGGKVKSGISPLIESPRFLRDHALDGYDAIFLLNFERLDATEIAALEAYVRAGGGVGIFLGELNQTEFINKQLYRDGEGLFPLPLVGVTELLVDRTEEVPDVGSRRSSDLLGLCRPAKQFHRHDPGRALFRRGQELEARRLIRRPKSSPACATARRWPSRGAWAKAVSSPF